MPRRRETSQMIEQHEESQDLGGPQFPPDSSSQEAGREALGRSSPDRRDYLMGQLTVALCSSPTSK